MPLVGATTQAARVKRIAITIPAAAGSADTLLNLIRPSLDTADLAQIVGGRVSATTADYRAGDAVALATYLTVPLGSSYTEPAANFLSATYVKAAAGAALSATVSVWLSGNGRLGL